MKILMVIPYVPNLVRIRPYNLLRFLAKSGHRITLATLWGNQQEYQDLAALQPFCERLIALPLTRYRSLSNCLLALPGRSPLQSVYCWNSTLADQINHLIGSAQDEPFDIVHVEHLRGAKYGISIKNRVSRLGLPLPVVWDSVDSISLLFRLAAKENKQLLTQLMTKFETGRTERYEKKLVDFFDHILVTSANDRQALLDFQGNALVKPPISVIPNGVDLEYFQMDPNLPREPGTIVISGKMSYHANVAMALYLVNEIMPLVWQHKPDTRVAVVGKDPPATVRKLGEDRRVEVTGTVPDLRIYLQRATIAAAPIRYGAGIQNKVLEAMACGAPVVATSGILSGIHAQAGKEILVADDAHSFAAILVNLLSDPEKQKEMSRAGRKYVETYHNWDEICRKLTQIYTEARERLRKQLNLAK